MDQNVKKTGPLRELVDSYKAGTINRRRFAQGATALGLSTPVVAFIANNVGAQDATPELEESGEALTRPEVGTEGQERGAGGDLNIIQWQAATFLSPHVATGVKEVLPSTMVLEPLIHYLSDASMIPNLVTKVPSQEDGDLADDLTSVTFNLLPDVLWSDGEPFTANDVGFTIDWVQNPDNASVNINVFEPIESYEVVDDLTITVNFSAPNPFWFTPFTGTSTGFVYPKHILEVEGAHDETFLSFPVGTGPYVVESFTPNDEATLVVNENYREPNKPFFSRVNLKGGGDAAAAARAVIQTGDYDFAWNLQLEPDIIEGMEAEDNVGSFVPYPGVSVERINFNFSDPNTEVDGQRSEMNTPHPFLTDPAVRLAIHQAVDRDLIAEQFYGLGQPAATNILNGDPRTDSPNTERVFDTDLANQTLEDAGWVMGDDGVREKDGVRLEVVYATSVNAVRQKTQAVVQQNLQAIGFDIQLEQVDAGIYFDGAVGNEQNINHFYWDFNMYQSVPSTPRPLSFFEAWYTGPDGDNIAQASNNWNGQNQSRYQNPEYDPVWEAANTEPDPEALADLFIEMNDIVINDHAILPLVVVGSPRGASNRLRHENLELAAYSYDYWNIANWNLADDAE